MEELCVVASVNTRTVCNREIFLGVEGGGGGDDGVHMSGARPFVHEVYRGRVAGEGTGGGFYLSGDCTLAVFVRDGCELCCTILTSQVFSAGF